MNLKLRVIGDPRALEVLLQALGTAWEVVRPERYPAAKEGSARVYFTLATKKPR